MRKTAGAWLITRSSGSAGPVPRKSFPWCPSCQIQIGEVALPLYNDSTGNDAVSTSIPSPSFSPTGWHDLRPLFIHPVNKRVALQERAALPGVVAAVRQVLGAIEGLEVVTLDVPVVSTQASHLSVLPKFKAELREREFQAADRSRLSPRSHRFSIAVIGNWCSSSPTCRSSC